MPNEVDDYAIRVISFSKVDLLVDLVFMYGLIQQRCSFFHDDINIDKCREICYQYIYLLQLKIIRPFS